MARSSDPNSANSQFFICFKPAPFLDRQYTVFGKVIEGMEFVDKIKRGDARQVSAGYKVDYDPTPGATPEGEEYSGVQRNIRVNHIAVVPIGRAGPEVKLLMDRMDAADAVAYDPEPGTPAQMSTQTASPNMASVKLDGLEIDLPVVFRLIWRLICGH